MQHILIIFKDVQSLFVYTLNESLERLEKLLSLLPLDGIYFACSNEGRHVIAIKNVVKMRNWSIIHNSSTVQTKMYRLPKEKALEFEIR